MKHNDVGLKYEGVHHRLHDLLVGLVLGLDHDGLLLLGGEAVGVHGCNLFVRQDVPLAS